jgi:hypothetical protein
VKDGSGNPFMERSGIKECSEQPDRTVTIEEVGTRPNKNHKIALIF